MHTSLDNNELTPWYRQFWPWFLIALPGSVVIAGLSTLYIAILYSDDLVNDDYYRDGMAINRQLEKQQRAEARHLQATITILGNGIRVELSGQLDDNSLHLQLSHPLEADLDFKVPLQESQPGVYFGPLLRPVATGWYWTLQSDADQPWRLDGSLNAQAFDASGER